MNDELRSYKTKLRAQMRKEILRFPMEKRLIASWDVCVMAMELPEFRAAKTLIFFYPDETELNFVSMIDDCFMLRRRIAFMKVIKETHSMEARIVPSREMLKPGYRGIIEPTIACSERYTPSPEDIIFVPGMAFDQAGGRLGRGAGFYDRYLASIPVGTLRIALAHDHQLLPEPQLLPMEDHDQRVDIIITPSGVHRCPPR